MDQLETNAVEETKQTETETISEAVEQKTPKEQLEAHLKTIPDGLVTQTMKLDSHTILLQISVAQDRDTPAFTEEVATWSKNLKNLLPQNTLIVVTPDALKLEVHRPKDITLNFKDSTFENKDLLDSIKKTLQMGEKKITLNFKKCRFADKK